MILTWNLSNVSWRPSSRERKERNFHSAPAQREVRGPRCDKAKDVKDTDAGKDVDQGQR